MFDFFAKVLGFLETFLEFVFNIIENLFVALEILSKAIVFPLLLSGFVPALIGSAMIITVAVAVAKFILGR